MLRCCVPAARSTRQCALVLAGVLAHTAADRLARRQPRACGGVSDGTARAVVRAPGHSCRHGRGQEQAHLQGQEGRKEEDVRALLARRLNALGCGDSSAEETARPSGACADAARCGRRVDPFSKKDWYEVKAPSMFSSRNVGKTLVTRTQGTKVAPPPCSTARRADACVAASRLSCLQPAVLAFRG
jgi:hypothetical protein